ncbi:MAG: dihydroorotate dehydrogenase-like protein [Anaerolineae bacterium]
MVRTDMVDLTTTYLGMRLKNPLVASASPLTWEVDSVRQIEDAGIAAVVMHSLFEEEITHESQELDHYLHRGSLSFSEALDFFPEVAALTVGPEHYLEQLRQIKDAVDIPVIGSLNGVSAGGWVRHAKLIEEAGADALELNIYYIPTDIDLTGKELENTYIELVQAVREEVSIPVAVKLSPFFTCLPNVSWLLVEAGANGLVLFNRFYQPDFDLDSLEVVPNLTLSEESEMRLPLRWIAILSGRLDTDFALSTGVRSASGVLKAMMAGAKVAMMTSELLRNGPERGAEILADLQAWLEEYDYESIAQMQGSMNQKSVAEPAAFERANYMKALRSFEKALP